MNLRSLLNQVRDELDAQQIVVRFEERDLGVVVIAEDYADALLAKAELRRRGVIVIEK